MLRSERASGAPSNPPAPAGGFFIGKTSETSTPYVTEDELAELQGAPGSKLISRKLYADYAGFAEFIGDHGSSRIKALRDFLIKESEAGVHAGRYRTWSQVACAMAGAAQCRRCRVIKSAEEFVSDKSRRGKSTLCKLCDANRKKRARDTDLERARALERRKYHARIDRYRALARARTDASRLRYPNRELARIKAREAERKGILMRPAMCEAISCAKERELHRHHPNYAEPLTIIWLCQRCHVHVHHVGPLKLKEGAARKIARAPRTATLLGNASG